MKTIRVDLLIFFYVALGVLVLGYTFGLPVLELIGGLVLGFFLVVFAIPVITTACLQSAMYRHPERYETVFTEDEEGNAVGVTWKRVS